MIKCKVVSILALFLLYQQIMPSFKGDFPGGGTFLYRHHQGDVEFLFSLDPDFFTAKLQYLTARQGFEYSCGKLDDPNDNTNLADPLSFLRGAVRETLEELVFIPTYLLKLPFPYQNNQINKQQESNFINEFVDKVKKQGIFFIYKPKIKGNTSKNFDQNAIFFFDITHICPQNLPETIVQQRINLQSNGYNFKTIGAEPIAFAWVKGKDLLNLLSQHGQWVNFSQYAEHNVQTNQMVTANATVYPQVVKSNQICISPACMGMMADRVGDPHNNQPNIAVIQRLTDFLLFDEQTNTTSQLSLSQAPSIRSSSMSAVIKLLKSNPQILRFTSAPPLTPSSGSSTPTTQKFDVQAWIKQNSPKLKNVIKNLLFPNDLVDFYAVITDKSLTPVDNMQQNDENVLQQVVEKLRQEVVNEKKKGTPPQPISPHAPKLTMNALELASLLPQIS